MVGRTAGHEIRESLGTYHRGKLLRRVRFLERGELVLNSVRNGG